MRGGVGGGHDVWSASCLWAGGGGRSGVRGGVRGGYDVCSASCLCVGGGEVWDQGRGEGEGGMMFGQPASY